MLYAKNTDNQLVSRPLFPRSNLPSAATASSKLVHAQWNHVHNGQLTGESISKSSHLNSFQFNSHFRAHRHYLNAVFLFHQQMSPIDSIPSPVKTAHNNSTLMNSSMASSGFGPASPEIKQEPSTKQPTLPSLRVTQPQIQIEKV